MRSTSLARQLIVMGVFCFLIGIIIIGYYVREYFRLRKKTETLADMAGRDKLTGALTTERFYADAQKVLDGIAQKGRAFGPGDGRPLCHAAFL